MKRYWYLLPSILALLLIVGIVSLLTPQSHPQAYNGKVKCQYADTYYYMNEDDYPPFACSVRFEKVTATLHDEHDTDERQNGSDIHIFFRGIWSFLVRLFTDPIASFTGILTISTVALWMETRRGAKTAERALNDLERPHLFVIIDPTLTEFPGSGGDIVAVSFTILNGGRFPAEIIECHADFSQTNAPRAGTLRDQFHAIVSQNDPIKDIRLAPTGPLHSVIRSMSFGEDETITPIPSTDYDTVFIISLRYRGIGEDIYTSEFSWHWDHAIGRWGHPQSHRT